MLEDNDRTIYSDKQLELASRNKSAQYGGLDDIDIISYLNCIGYHSREFLRGFSHERLINILECDLNKNKYQKVIDELDIKNNKLTCKFYIFEEKKLIKLPDDLAFIILSYYDAKLLSILLTDNNYYYKNSNFKNYILRQYKLDNYKYFINQYENIWLKLVNILSFLNSKNKLSREGINYIIRLFIPMILKIFSYNDTIKDMIVFINKSFKFPLNYYILYTYKKSVKLEKIDSRFAILEYLLEEILSFAERENFSLITPSIIQFAIINNCELDKILKVENV